MNNKEKKLFSKMKKIENQEFCEEMQDLISNKKSKQHILVPINGNLKCIFQKSGNIDTSIPIVSAILDIEEVSIALDDIQYKNIMSVLNYMSNFQKLEEFRRIKPSLEFKKETLDDWWSFAYNSTKKIIKKKYFSWSDVLKRKEERETYIQLYKRKMELPWLEKLSGSDLNKFISLEEKLSYEDLILFRGLSQAEIDLEMKNNKKLIEVIEKKKEKAKRWFSWGGGEDEEQAPAVIELTKEQRNEIYKTIGYDTKKEIEDLKFPEDVRFKINLEYKIQIYS
jgi:hypothetical protein